MVGLTTLVRGPTADAPVLELRFYKGIAWNLLATLFNQGSTFLINVIVANILGRRLFGEYAMVLSTIQSLSLITGLAMGYTATKYVAELRSTDPERAGQVLGFCSIVSGSMGTIAATVLFALAPVLSASSLNTPHLAPLLGLGAGVLLFSTMNSYLTGALAGLEGYRALGRAGVLTGLLSLTICAGSAWALGLMGAVAGLLASTMVQWLVLRYAVKREAALQGIFVYYGDLQKERSILLKFSLPGALSGLTAAPALWLGQVFLARQTGGYDELALYSAAYNLMTIVLFLPNVANNVGMSLINNMGGQGNSAQYRRVFWMNLLFTATIVVLGMSVMALGGKYVLGAFGESFQVGLPVLFLLLVATVPEALTIAINQVLQSQEKMWHAIFFINVPRDTMMPLSAYLLVPSLGAAGLAWAYVAGRILAFTLIALLVWRIGLDKHGELRTETDS